MSGSTFFVLLFAVLSSSTALVYQNCTSTLGQTSKVVIAPPCTSNPCEVHASEEVNVTITFVPNTAVENFTVVVHATIGTLNVPYPVANPNGCDTAVTGVTCPLKANAPVEWTHPLTLPKTIPAGVTVIIKWELNVSTNNDVSCFEFVCKVA